MSRNDALQGPLGRLGQNVVATGVKRGRAPPSLGCGIAVEQTSGTGYRRRPLGDRELAEAVGWESDYHALDLVSSGGERDESESAMMI